MIQVKLKSYTWKLFGLWINKSVGGMFKACNQRMQDVRKPLWSYGLNLGLAVDQYIFVLGVATCTQQNCWGTQQAVNGQLCPSAKAISGRPFFRKTLFPEKFRKTLLPEGGLPEELQKNVPEEVSSRTFLEKESSGIFSFSSGSSSGMRMLSFWKNLFQKLLCSIPKEVIPEVSSETTSSRSIHSNFQKKFFRNVSLLTIFLILL